MWLPEGFLPGVRLVQLSASKGWKHFVRTVHLPCPRCLFRNPRDLHRNILGQTWLMEWFKYLWLSFQLIVVVMAQLVKSNVKVISMKWNRHLPKDHLLALTLPYGFSNFRKQSDNMQSLPSKAWFIYPHKHKRGRGVKTVISYSALAFPLGTASLFLWFCFSCPWFVCVPAFLQTCLNSIFQIIQFLIFPHRGSHFLPGKNHPL